MEDAECGVDARIAGAAVADAAAEDVGRPPADHVHVLLARVHVGTGHVAAAERLDQVAVALEQSPPLVAERDLGHGEHRLAASAREAEHGQLARHPGRQPQAVLERVRRLVVRLQPRSSHGWAQPGRMDADEHPGSRRLVVPDDDVLAVPPPQQVLEHVSTLLGRERAPKPRDPLVERVVGCGQREAREAPALRAEPLARRDGDAMVVQQPLERDPSGSGNQTKNVPSQRAPGIAATARSRRRS